MELSIVIVSYNIRYFLEQCLYAVQRASAQLQTEVYVVDNNSTDGSVAYLSALFPEVHFIANKQNLGFAKACNQPLPLCQGKYILFLNPDTIVAEDTFSACVQFMDANEKAGALGCRMIDGAGNFLQESKRSFPSASVSFYKLSGLSSLFPSSTKFNKYVLGHLPEDQVHMVDVLCGAFMMVRQDVLLKLKGFDEDYFMYAEDIDLSYRIKKAGYRNYYFPGTTIVHFKGESSKQDENKHLHLFYGAMKIFVRKHYWAGKAGLYSNLLTLAIYLRAAISFFSLPLKLIKGRNKTKKIKNFQLIGDEEAVSTLQKRLRQKMAEASAIKDEKPGAAIFCINRFSCKQAIEMLSLSYKQQEVRWHHHGSGSVVGSTDKDATGQVIVL